MIFAIGMFLVFAPFVFLLLAMVVFMYIDLIHNKHWMGVAFCTSMLLGLMLLAVNLFLG